MDQALDSLRPGQAGSISAGPSGSAALTLLQYPQFLWITERSPSNRITLVVQPMAPASVTQFSYCSIEKKGGVVGKTGVRTVCGPNISRCIKAH
ncbi:hypothetical protein AOLI_G00087140 [Acnodon oligacanthus]